MNFKGIFTTLSNTYDGAFCFQPSTILENAPYYMFDRVLNTPLDFTSECPSISWKNIWGKVFKNGPSKTFLRAVFQKLYLVHSSNTLSHIVNEIISKESLVIMFTFFCVSDSLSQFWYTGKLRVKQRNMALIKVPLFSNSLLEARSTW